MTIFSFLCSLFEIFEETPKKDKGIENKGELIKVMPSIAIADMFSGYDNMQLHWANLYLYYFQDICSVYEIVMATTIEREKFIEKLNEKYNFHKKQIIRTDTVFNNKKSTDSYSSEVFIVIKPFLAIWMVPEKINILYNINISITEVFEIAAIADECKIIEKDPTKEFSMIVRSDERLKLYNYVVKPFEINIEENYNNDFAGINEIITHSLTDNNKNGLILLHGSYGSGKTYYIRHLIRSVNKKFIYLPLHMLHCLADPEFLPFITKHENSVLIIEDCENILMHGEDGNPNANALSNLLNLSDGLLSDALSLNIICTFNANLTKIDDALLRKGRIIARYKFRELEITKAQYLADKLEKNIVIDKPTLLSNIYNAESQSYENIKTNKIGFACV